MKRTPVRIAVASAMTAAIALGTVSAAEAKPRTTSRSTSVAAKQAQHRKAAAAAKRLTIAKANVVREATRKVSALSRVDRHIVEAELGAEHTDAVRANIAADKAALQALARRVTYASTLADASKAAGLVASYRPENYEQVKDILQLDKEVAAEVDAIRQAVAEIGVAADVKAAEGGDVTAVQAALAAATTGADQAAAAVTASVAHALTVRATTPKATASSPLRLAAVEADEAAAALEVAQAEVEESKVALDAVVIPAPDSTTSAL